MVETLAPRKIRLWTEFSGRLHAVDYAEIRPEVSGYITDVKFTDGQMVKTGDLLFVIDPRPYEAAVERDQAALISAQSKLTLADRCRPSATPTLIQTHSVSQDELDTHHQRGPRGRGGRTERRGGAQAGQARPRARLRHSADLRPRQPRGNHAWATSCRPAPARRCSPPSSRRTASTPTSTSTSRPIWRPSAPTPTATRRSSKIPVQLVVPGDNGHVYDGFIESFDNRIDPASDTIRARARFANADGALVPGMFVTVRLAGAAERSCCSCRSAPISFDQSKASVFVVDARTRSATARWSSARPVDADRVVESGLHAGDRIIVDGVQLVRPDDSRRRDRDRPRRPATLAGNRAEGPPPRHEPLAVLHRPPDLRGRALVPDFLAGLISVFQLPISEYPEVVPPTVVVTAQFPGANPKVIAETVATPLEEQINGVEDMLYMFSQAAERRHADADRHLQARHRSRTSRSSSCRTASPRRCRACRTWCSSSA